MTKPLHAQDVSDVQFEDEFIDGLKDMVENKIVFNSVIGLKITSITPNISRIAMRCGAVCGRRGWRFMPHRG